MLFELVFSFPWWFILLCLLAGLVYSLVLYRKDTRLALPKYLMVILGSLRFLSVSLLAFLLLGPYLKIQSKSIEKPIVIIAQDNSQSLSLVHDSAFLDSYKQALIKATDRLGERFDIRLFSFGSNLSEGKNWLFNEPATDFSLLRNEIQQRFVNTNTGALILSSDGLFNRGNNPYYLFRDLGFPVYTIAMGDTIQKKDLLIARVDYNKQVTAGNRLLMEVIIEAKNASGSAGELKITSDSGEVFSRMVNISGNRFFQKIPVNLLPVKKGMNKYTLRLNRLEGEITYVNNEKTIYVEVIDVKHKILMLAASPHPDVATIRNVIESNPNYEFTYSGSQEFQGAAELYSLIIFHNCPVNQNESGIINRAMKSGIPCWFIIGTQTSVALFNQLQTGIYVSENRPSPNEIFPVYQKEFSLFTLPESWPAALAGFPPLTAPFGNYKINQPLQVLLSQRIGNVFTHQPMLAFNQSTSKSAVLTGEGLWKWRLAEVNRNGNPEFTNELISKTVQYLIQNEKKQPLRLFYKKEYDAAEPVTMDAELINPSGELINEPDVKLTLYGEGQAQYEFMFSKNNMGGYSLNAGRLETGKYRLKASAHSGDKPVTAEGEFTITATNYEALSSAADHQLLYSLAENSGGKMFYPEQIEMLINDLLSRKDLKPISFSEKKLKDLIDLKWIFYLCMLLLSIEWLIRKRSGAY